MKFIGKGILLFFLLIVGYHIFHTFFLYGINVGTPILFVIGKDVLWGILSIASFSIFGLKYRNFMVKGGTKKNFLTYNALNVGILGDFCARVGRKSAKKMILSFLFFLVLLLRSLFISGIQGVSRKMMIVGMKYDIYPLLLIFIGIVLGYMFYVSYEHWGYKDEKFKISVCSSGNTLCYTLLRFFCFLLIFVLLGGLMRQCTKIFIPELFEKLGYGPVGDYVIGLNPPLYYRTGPGGTMRLQGLFSGPNNYGYFLVVFFSFVVLFTTRIVGQKGVYTWKNKKVRFFFLFLYVISLGRTFSRGVIVGVAIQIFLLFVFLTRFSKRGIIFFTLLLFGGLLVLLSIRKWNSTVLHMESTIQGWQALVRNPWGYGLGSSGPAIHYNGTYLPENYYLQIALDLGIPGFFLWIATLSYMLSALNRSRIYALNRKIESKEECDCVDWFLFALLLGFFGLLGEGLFLHVLEDSMVNYLFLPLLGCMISLHLLVKD